jgi:hypothetical protein
VVLLRVDVAADRQQARRLGLTTMNDISERLAKEMEARLTEAMLGGPAKKQRQTALRLHGRSFETVALDDAGNVIEPIRCTCGAWALFHRSGCPFAYAVT